MRPAIATMFAGLTMATLLGVPFGAWFGLLLGWRAAFWAVTVVGVAALVVLALVLPRQIGNGAATTSVRDELTALMRPQVQLGLATTALGFAGLFTVFTYIQPILMEVAGFSKTAVSPILLVFGVGLSIGNLFGGRLADRGLGRALLVTLASLIVVLLALAPAMNAQIPIVALVGFLGAAAFATAPPLQLRVLEKAGEAGRTLASSLNIAAFNIGNAFGAWVGSATIAHGAGLTALPVVAAAITALGFAVALWSLHLDRRPIRAVCEQS